MSVSDTLITAGIRALGMLSRLRSPQGRISMGKTMGHAMMRMDARRLRITHDNVSRAFPEMSAAEHEAIVRGSYENLGITMAELLAVPAMTEDEVRHIVHAPGIEQLQARAAQQKPTILISGHMGNWEMVAMSGALQAGTSLTIVVHPQKNRQADALLNAYRTRFGNQVVPMREAARTLVRTLNNGGTVAFLADQHANADKDAWIPFFGRPTPTYEAPAALALRFGIPIMTSFAVRQPDGTYEAPLQELRSDDLSNDREGVRTLTERHVRALEDVVRAHPDMWSWQHRRWRKERP